MRVDLHAQRKVGIGHGHRHVMLAPVLIQVSKVLPVFLCMRTRSGGGRLRRGGAFFKKDKVVHEPQ